MPKTRKKQGSDDEATAVIDVAPDSAAPDAPTPKPRRRRGRAATTANGITPPSDVPAKESGAEEPATVNAPEPKPRRRRGGAATAANDATPPSGPPTEEPTAEEPATVDAPAPKPRRRRGGAATAANGATPPSEPPAEEPPAEQGAIPALPPAEEPPAATSDADIAAARSIAEAVIRVGDGIPRQGRIAVLHDLETITGDDYGTKLSPLEEVHLRGLTLEGFIDELKQPNAGRVGALPRFGATAARELLRLLQLERQKRINLQAPFTREPTPAPAEQEAPAPVDEQPVVVSWTFVNSQGLSHTLTPYDEERLGQMIQLWQTLTPSAQRAVLVYAAMLAIEP